MSAFNGQKNPPHAGLKISMGIVQRIFHFLKLAEILKFKENELFFLKVGMCVCHAYSVWSFLKPTKQGKS